MKPFRPLSHKEIKQYIADSQARNALLENENVILKEQVEALEDDSKNIKASAVIQQFQNATKAQLLALTAAQRNETIFKVLKALVWENY